MGSGLDFCQTVLTAESFRRLLPPSHDSRQPVGDRACTPPVNELRAAVAPAGRTPPRAGQLPQLRPRERPVELPLLTPRRNQRRPPRQPDGVCPDGDHHLASLPRRIFRRDHRRYRQDPAGRVQAAGVRQAPPLRSGQPALLQNPLAQLSAFARVSEITSSIVFAVSRNRAIELPRISSQMAERSLPGRYQSDFAAHVASSVSETPQFTFNFGNDRRPGPGRFLPAYKTNNARL